MEPPAEPADDEVEQGGEVDRLGDPEGRDQEEPRRAGAEDRPEGVDGIERPHPPAHPFRRPHEEPAQDRKRGPHQRGRHQKKRSAEKKPDQAQDIKGGLRLLVDELVDRLGGVDQKRQEQAVEADGSLQGRKDAQRIPATVDEPPPHEAPQGQAGHEHAQHRGDGEGGVAHDQAQEARPDDLVDQAGRPRDEESAQDTHRHQAGGGVGPIL